MAMTEYRSQFIIGGFGTMSPTAQMIVIRSMLEALVVVNIHYLKERPETSRLYDVKPRYILPKPNRVELWQDVVETYRRGEGSCKEFACIRVAELRQDGFTDVVPYIKLSTYHDPHGARRPLTLFHVLVRNGEAFEDPSEILGMRERVSYDELRGQPDAGGVADARWGLEQWVT
jgi:hypothetical protein